MKTTYKEMAIKLSNKESFKGNSIAVGLNEIGEYVVKSYNTVIPRVRKNNTCYFDNSYYSTTTSRIQNMLIDIFGLNNGLRKRG